MTTFMTTLGKLVEGEILQLTAKKRLIDRADERYVRVVYL